MNEIGTVQQGEVLVCSVTAPSWAPVFPKIAAAVSDIGGMMSHAAIIAREYGLPAVVGTGHATKQIKTGDRVRVDGDNGRCDPLLTLAERTNSFQELRRPLSCRRVRQPRRAAAGFAVPPGFAVTTAAYERDDIGTAVGEAYAELGRVAGRTDPPVAVRSSAIAEDMPDASFAGVQDTYLWISGLEAVLDGIGRCWASYRNPEAVAYREAHGITRGGMGVAVQSMVDARVAALCFC